MAKGIISWLFCIWLFARQRKIKGMIAAAHN